MEQPSPAVELDDADYRVRLRAIHRLVEAQPKLAGQWIRRMLHDRESPVRNAAIVALGELRDQGSFDALVGCLAAPAARERMNAVEALVALDNPLTRVPLVAALEAESNGSVRTALIRALSRFPGDERIIDALMRRLADHDEDVRATAAIALARVGAHKALPALRRMAARDTKQETSINGLWEANSTVAQRAIAALISSDQPAALDSLDWPDY